MKTISRFLGLSAISAIALGLVALPSVASAQSATPTTSSNSGCAAGCPGTSVIGITTMGGIQGSFQGMFGAFDSDGDAVDDETLEGTVDGYKYGEVSAESEVTMSGLCNTCTTVGGNASVNASENAGVSVWLSGSQGGTVYGGANSASVGTIAAISSYYQPYVPAAVNTHTED